MSGRSTEPAPERAEEKIMKIGMRVGTFAFVAAVVGSMFGATGCTVRETTGPAVVRRPVVQERTVVREPVVRENVYVR